MGRFKPLIEFSAYHAYMGDTPCHALHFQLDPASGPLINRTGLLVRSAGGSIEVLFDERRAGELKTLAAEESATLFWRMHSTDRSIAGCTSPSLMRAGKTLNIRLEQGSFPDISDSEFVGEMDFINLSDDTLPGLLALRDRGDEQAGEKLVQMLDAQLGQLLTPRDLLLPPLAFYCHEN